MLRGKRGLSIIELTVVIAMMLTLTAIITYSVSSMTNWKAGRTAGESLKSVYMAQKGYLADHPTQSASSFTSEKLIPYLPGRPGSLPTAKTLENQDLTLKITVMPPVFELGGTKYDPSDKTDDGLWDTAGL